MASSDLKSLIQVGFDVLNTSLDAVTGKILAQLGSVHGETVDSEQAEWWQQQGFVSRPPKPAPGKQATQAIVFRTGDYDIAFASQDLRGLDLYALLNYGEICAYAAGEDGLAQARSVWKKDGSINHYTTDTNTKDGTSVYERIAPDGISWVAPWGTLKFDATGFHINHSSGAQLSLGGIYGMPSPLDQIASYFRITAGTVNHDTSNMSTGGAADLPKQLASAEACAIAIASLQAQLAAVTKALAALNGDVTHAAAAIPTADAVTEVANGSSTVAAAILAIPTTAAAT